MNAELSYSRLWSVESLACKEVAATIRQQPCYWERCWQNLGMLAQPPSNAQHRAERITLTTGYLKYYDDVYISFAHGIASSCGELGE